MQMCPILQAQLPVCMGVYLCILVYAYVYYQCTQIQQSQLLSVLQAIMMVHDIASYSYLSSDAAVVLIIV